MTPHTPPRKQDGVSEPTKGASASPKIKRCKLPVSSKLPLPVSIELHNLFPKSRLVPNGGKAKRWFRPEYSTSLLCNVQMEISISEDDDDDDDEEQRTVIYTAVDHRRTVCPSWHHLSDVIHRKDLTVQTYETMRATFQVVIENENNNGDDDCPDDTTAAATTTVMRICQVNLHPSKLYRVSDPPPYDNLPLNCTLVRFTDNTVRVQPAHYQLLLSNNNNSPNRIHNNTNGNHHHPHSHKEHDSNDVKQTTAAMEKLRLEQEREDLHHRFEDKSFRALDQVVVAPPPPRKRTASGSSTGDPPSPSSLRLMLACDDSAVEEETNHSHHTKDDDDRANLDYLARENAALAQLLQRQERAWKREQSSSSLLRPQLEQLAADLPQRHAELAQLRDAVDRERRALNQTEFWLAAGRIRLVRELSVVYPVTTAATNDNNNSRSRRFLIRGLEIPTSLFAGAAAGNTAQPPPSPPPDEEVAAALGFLAHATQLLSKYLDVHLRYRLHCHASRSAIQGGGDERGSSSSTIYPLFPGRAVDREQLEYAVHLLDRNVDCLCAARGISFAAAAASSLTGGAPPPQVHVLAKVKRIYEQVIEGY